MGNQSTRHDRPDGEGGSSFHGRESSFRRLRRWASRVSLRSSGDGAEQRQQQQQQQQSLVNKWNRESRKRIHQSTLSDRFGSSKTKWPVPFIESLFLPDFPIRGGPEEIEDFEVIDVIAAGSFGNVLKVRGDDDKKVYALKVIDKARVLTHGHAVVQQCKDEVAVQKAVGRSRFVAGLMQHWQTRKRLYLLVEFVPNGELFALWRLHRQFSESLARFYVAELACCLDFLHGRGVVFRDLKLENVVLDHDGHLVLIDFGLCKRLRKGQTTLTICGTLAYSAPEMLSGHPYDHAVDWWSLGILFYALVVGKFPLHGARHHKQMAQMVRRHEYEAPAHLTWECRYTLEQLLQKRPNRRLANLPSLRYSPFFKNRLNFDLVESHGYDPASFFTQDDLSRRPAEAQSRRLTRTRPPDCQSEENFTPQAAAAFPFVDSSEESEGEGEGEESEGESEEEEEAAEAGMGRQFFGTPL